MRVLPKTRPFDDEIAASDDEINREDDSGCPMQFSKKPERSADLKGVVITNGEKKEVSYPLEITFFSSDV